MTADYCKRPCSAWRVPLI